MTASRWSGRGGRHGSSFAVVRRSISTPCERSWRPPGWYDRRANWSERSTTGKLFHLHVGDLAVDLRYQMPFDLANWPNRLTLLRDGWRIDQICRYRPLIYYAAFGSPENLEQFAVSVRSLIEFGRYQGPILVLTDQTPRHWQGISRRKTWRGSRCCRSSRTTGPAIMAARYLILDWPEPAIPAVALRRYRHRVRRRRGADAAHAVAISDRIAAPIELHSTWSSSAASGATLIQRDFCSPGSMAGFNTGTLGIPNLRAHAETLRLIRRIIANHAPCMAG